MAYRGGDFKRSDTSRGHRRRGERGGELPWEPVGNLFQARGGNGERDETAGGLIWGASGLAVKKKKKEPEEVASNSLGEGRGSAGKGPEVWGGVSKIFYKKKDRGGGGCLEKGETQVCQIREWAQLVENEGGKPNYFGPTDAKADESMEGKKTNCCRQKKKIVGGGL